MSKVLLVTYFYPPYQSIGAVRASKFSRYLPEFGWQPVVLAAHNDYLAALPLEVPEHVVHRTGQIDVNRLPKMFAGKKQVAETGYAISGGSLRGRLVRGARDAYKQVVNFPDGQVGWYPYAVAAGKELVKRERPDVIFSSAGPATAHLVAHRLARSAGVPWVAEFRDLWTDNHIFRRRGPLRGVEVAMERRAMAGADALVTVSEGWAEILRARFGKPVHVIPNGYDAEDYPAHAAQPERFTLAYTGMFYPGQQIADPLLDGMALLHREGAITPDNFRFRLTGRYLEPLVEAAARRGLSALVEAGPPVPHGEALRLQRESSALVLFLWGSDEGKDCYPGKLFEYMGAGRPVLAIGGDDDGAAKLIVETKAGRVAGTAEAVAAALREWMAAHAAGALPPAVPSASVARFERRALTETLAGVLESVRRPVRGAAHAAQPSAPTARHAG